MKLLYLSLTFRLDSTMLVDNLPSVRLVKSSQRQPESYIGSMQQDPEISSRKYIAPESTYVTESIIENLRATTAAVTAVFPVLPVVTFVTLVTVTGY